MNECMYVWMNAFMYVHMYLYMDMYMYIVTHPNTKITCGNGSEAIYLWWDGLSLGQWPRLDCVAKLVSDSLAPQPMATPRSLG